MSVSKVDDARKVNVLLIGESRFPFSFCLSPLEKAGCQCQFVESRREMDTLLSHTELDIVLSLNAQHALSEIVALLADSRVSMFHRVPVEEGCWWLPSFEMATTVLARLLFGQMDSLVFLLGIVKGIITNATLSPHSMT